MGLDRYLETRVETTKDVHVGNCSRRTSIRITDNRLGIEARLLGSLFDTVFSFSWSEKQATGATELVSIPLSGDLCESDRSESDSAPAFGVGGIDADLVPHLFTFSF